MEQSSRIEVHFYTEYEAAVVVETFAQGEERKSVVVRSFVSYAARQLRNLGANGRPLAQLLAAMRGTASNYVNYYDLVHGLRTPQEMALYMPFIAALGVDMGQIVASVTEFAMLRAAAGGDNAEIARTLWPDIARVVGYRGWPGKKRFEANIDLHEDRASIHLDPKGFGPFGQGVNYYAPMSVVLLQRYLTEKYERDMDDFGFSGRLCRAAQGTGRAFLDGNLSAIAETELPARLDAVPARE